MKGAISGSYKHRARDFIVCEELPFEPAGDGEHVYLRISKRGLHTREVQARLARLAGVPRHHVGYAGLKDRQALTRQWFSVYLPGGAEPDWACLGDDSLEIQQHTRHRRKLRVGAHCANRFSLVLRDLSGDRSRVEQGLADIVAGGFPNYFGEQRFGHGGAATLDLSRLGRLRKGRLSPRQAMALSAARARVFNRLLARREAEASWNRVLPGELVNLDGSNSFFGPVDDGEALAGRLASLEVHPTGPLPGSEDGGSTGEAKLLEDAAMAAEPEAMALVCRLAAKAARRPLRARAVDLVWQWLEGDVLQLDFALRPGSYATSVLAALGEFRAADGAVSGQPPTPDNQRAE